MKGRLHFLIKVESWENQILSKSRKASFEIKCRGDALQLTRTFGIIQSAEAYNT